MERQKDIPEIKQWVEEFFQKNAAFELDYFCIANANSLQAASTIQESQKMRAFIAVKLGDIRLIDNVNF